MTKKVVLLYGDTGGGHRSAAQSIAKGLRTDTTAMLLR